MLQAYVVAMTANPFSPASTILATLTAVVVTLVLSVCKYNLIAFLTCELLLEDNLQCKKHDLGDCVTSKNTSKIEARMKEFSFSNKI